MAYLDNKGTKTESFNELINIRITLSYENMFVRYMFEENENLVSKRNKKNLEKLLDLINYEVVYNQEPTELYYFKTLKIICNFINKRHINDPQIIFDFLIDEVPENEIPEKIKIDIFENLNSEEYDTYDSNKLNFITEYIESKLNYIEIYKKIEPLQNSITNLKSDIGKSTIECINDLDYIISDLFHNMKKNKTDNNINSTEFDSNNIENAEEILDQTLNEFKNPKNKLLTPWQNFNNMIGGGLEKGRCYLLCGLPKQFKSGTLLNIALGVCRFNKGYKLKDPTKKPVVYYFTQENTVKETLQRLLAYCGINQLDNLSGSDALKLINDFIMRDTGIGFKFKYKPNKSVNTSYLYELVDKAAEEGDEVILMIQDYTKRIRSMVNYPDLRIELGEVVNDFTVFAKEYDIPIISAAQLNREAFRIMEMMNEKNIHDIGKKLNASHIGESALLLENTDVGIIINKETLKITDYGTGETLNEENYLSFKLIAYRGERKPNEKVKEYFAQPFVPDNGFRILEDLNEDEPLSKDSIGSELESLSNCTTISNRMNTINNLASQESIDNTLNSRRVSRRNSSGISISNTITEIDDSDLF